MAAIRKFTFDNDFDRPAKPVPAKPEVVAEPPPPPPPPTFSEAEMAAAVAAARKAAHAEGVAQGRAETVADAEKRIAAVGSPKKSETKMSFQHQFNEGDRNSRHGQDHEPSCDKARPSKQWHSKQSHSGSPKANNRDDKVEPCQNR